MTRAIKKTIILIALIILTIAAVLFACKISSFSSLDELHTKIWLHFSEAMLIVSAVLLTAGLLGEWPDSESWKKRLLYKAAKGAVILGVVGELLGDAGVFVAGDRLQEITDGIIREQNDKIIALETRLAQRVIPPDKAKTMVESLRKFAGTPFDFSINPSPEPETFADRIHEILKEANWKPVPFPVGGIALGTADDRSRILISSMELGIEISSTKYGEWREPLEALQKALADAGFVAKANVATDGSAPDNAIHIYVGAKQ